MTTTSSTFCKKKIRAVFIDLSGTLHIGDEEIPGARHALQRLRRSWKTPEGIRIRFLTNTSTKSVAQLVDQLNNKSSLNFDISPDEMITSVKATVDYIRRNALNPLLLMEDTSDFTHAIKSDAKNGPTSEHPRDGPYDSVVVGLAPSQFYYAQLNLAFRILLEHPDNLVAIHRGNYIRDVDGGLSLGPGAFVTSLETASKCKPAKVMGKPSKKIFEAALRDINSTHDQETDVESQEKNGVSIISADEVCMIGDDVSVDCEGALKAGIGTSILVQTGKYRTDDEMKLIDHSLGGNFIVCLSIVEAVDFILGQG